MASNVLLSGPQRYEANAQQSWLLAVAVTIGIIIAAQLAPAAVAYGLIRLAPGGAAALNVSAGHLMLLTLLSQAVMVALTLAAAKGGTWATRLKLQMPEGGVRTLGASLLLLIPLLAVFNLVAYLLAPGLMAKDFKQILELSRSEAFPQTMLAIGIGAPISEELLFRGYLLPVLARTVLGYLPAALLACLIWTLLHLQYSIVGLTEVFIIGAFFSWLLWRTNSLVPAIFCHAVYNAGLLLLLRFGPF